VARPHERSVNPVACPAVGSATQIGKHVSGERLKRVVLASQRPGPVEAGVEYVGAGTDYEL